MNDEVAIDRTVVSALVTDTDEAATAMGDSAVLLADDAAAAADGLAGFETAGLLTATQAAWDRKASACRDSIGLFADALRGTMAALPSQDRQNAAGIDAVEFVFPEGSPILAGEPPWVAP